MLTHTFAICAYGDSPYLEACIRSLKAQTAVSRIILCTSTPSHYIDSLAGKYGIPVFAREGKSDIQTDWNFAYEMADSDLVTIAHQDDCYHKDYGFYAIKAMEKYPDATMFASDCVIVKNGEIQKPDSVKFVKKLLRLPLRVPAFNHLSWVKKSALIFGNPIICPSCTYNKRLMKGPLFQSSYKFALDWDTLLSLAEEKGRFIVTERPLVYYRIHEGAATKACIEDNRRVTEELEMFGKLWPKPVAGLLEHFYKKACKAYDS